MVKIYSTEDAAAYLGITVSGVKYHVYTVGDLQADNWKPGQKRISALMFTPETLDTFKAVKRSAGKPLAKFPVGWEVKALELLAVADQPVDGKFVKHLDRLVRRGLAQRQEDGYQITPAGCDWITQHLAGSSSPAPDAPCGWRRTD